MDTVKQVAATVADKLNLTTEPPVEPDAWLKADEVETIKPDEDDKARQIGEAVRRLQSKNFDQHSHMYRGTHVSLPCT